MSAGRDRLPIQAVFTFVSKGKRPDQEDFLLVDREKGIFVVADGFGGPISGFEAAKGVCEAVRSFLFREAGDLEATLPFVLRSYFSLAGNVLFNSLIYANKKITALNRGKSVHERGGASAIAGFIDGDLMALANIGVCTAWMFRKGEALELVVPRTYGRLIDPFQPHEKEEYRIPLGALGMSEDLEPEIFEYKIRRGDWILFSTDGINSIIYDQILKIQQKQLSSDQSVQLVSQFLNQFEFSDNAAFSIVIV